MYVIWYVTSQSATSATAHNTCTLDAQCTHTYTHTGYSRPEVRLCLYCVHVLVYVLSIILLTKVSWQLELLRLDPHPAVIGSTPTRTTVVQCSAFGRLGIMRLQIVC